MNSKKEKRDSYNWPDLYYNKKPLSYLIGQTKHAIKPLALPSQLIEYLVIVCDQLKISNAVLQLTLSLSARFLRLRPNSLPLQLIVMTSLMVCCKFLETNPPELSLFHRLSCNSYTNRDFYRTEMIILNELHFDITAEGIPNRQMNLIVRCASALLRPQYEPIFPSIITDLEILFWNYLYTGRIKLREKEERAINATIIHLSLVFLTQFSGRFLQTVWACELTETEEKEVNVLGNRFLKQMLGQQKSKNYKL